LAFLRDLLFGNRWLYDEMIANCEDFVVGRDLPELVAKNERAAGRRRSDLDTLRAATESYDAQIERGQTAQRRAVAAHRLCAALEGRPHPHLQVPEDPRPKAGPLIAVREFIISRKSLGGIQTDLQSRVLDHAGKPSRPVRGGRSGRLRRRRHARPARPRRRLPRRLHPHRPHRGTSRRGNT
jgi:predicted oxidoreductase